MTEKCKLSIVVLSFNTKDLLGDCLESLTKVRNEVNFEVVVVDNGSSDGTIEMVEEKFPSVFLIQNAANVGFAKGNNSARGKVHGEYVLFLNSDTVVPEGTLRETLDYLSQNSQVGALTCKIVLPTGNLDKDVRRSFITPWVGLTHLILRLDRIFPESKFLARYWYGYLPEDLEHEVDALQGAFFLTRKKILDEIDWFDEDYFLDGEDIDLCWRIKEKGWKIVYYPKVSIIHHKGATKGKVGSVRKKEVSLKERIRYRMAGVDSMEIFYRKRLWSRYPFILNTLVILGIKAIKIVRFGRFLIFG